MGGGFTFILHSWSPFANLCHFFPHLCRCESVIHIFVASPHPFRGRVTLPEPPRPHIYICIYIYIIIYMLSTTCYQRSIKSAFLVASTCHQRSIKDMVVRTLTSPPTRPSPPKSRKSHKTHRPPATALATTHARLT